MRGIKNQNLAQLLMQVPFAPEKQRRRQLDAAEKLVLLIERGKEYPFEFVCYHLTGYRPKTKERQDMIPAEELIGDLQIFITKLSGKMPQQAAEQSQTIYTIEHLAKEFRVSTKTIDRWRKNGLTGRKYIFEDGKRLIGFSQSTVDKFAKSNSAIVTRAHKFKRLSEAEKKLIVTQAHNLAADGNLSRRQVINRIALENNRSAEAVRYTLIEHEKLYPNKPVFKRPSGVVKPEQAAQIYQLYKDKVPVKQLMQKFYRSKSSIYRIINKRQARELLAQKIEFIDSNEFLQKGAEKRILSSPAVSSKISRQRVIDSLDSVKDSLPQYLQAIKNIQLLKRQQETELFRKYNYLKYLFCANRAKINLSRVRSSLLKEVQGYLTEAQKIKKIIIEANLRLVVSIANKHATGQSNLADLISEGNLALIRAVEKFDYARGFRFSTYASWVIAKDYVRKIPAEAKRPDRAGAVEFADIQQDKRVSDAAGVIAIESAHRSLDQVITNNLDEHEQYIIRHHFGLIGSLVKKQRKSLKQIGDELGLSRTRIRQIELIALQKLRQSLSVEEFELLTG